MARALLLPILGFVLLISLLRIVGTALMFTLPGEKVTASAPELLGGLVAAVAVSLACAWLMVKVWQWKPAASPSASHD